MCVYLFSKDFLIVYCVANNQIVKSFLFRVSAFRHSLNENPAPFGAIFLSIVIAVKKEGFVDQLTTTSMKKIQQQQQNEKENEKMREILK
jgi:hypothetical protein